MGNLPCCPRGNGESKENAGVVFSELSSGDQSNAIGSSSRQVGDINSASVDALTAVKGIGKALAVRIVEYREENGPFETMDKLSAVSGIGTSKVDALKESFDVLQLSGGVGKPERRRLDVNTASEEQLRSLLTVGNVLAKKIVEYREKHGAFTTLEELSNVQGIGESTFKTLTEYLEVKELKNSRDKIIDSKKGERKEREQNVVKIGSWNLERFSTDKASNEGVLEVICTTILKYRLSVVAFQELADESSLQKVCDQLNKPTIDAVKNLANRKQWQCVTSGVTGRMFKSPEFNGFLWDESKQISLRSSSILQKVNKSKPFVRQPFIGYFKVDKFDFVLVSVHLKATGFHNEDIDKLKAEIERLPQLVDAISEYVEGEKDIIITGDFNLESSAGDFKSLSEKGFHHLIPADIYTNVSVKNPLGSEQYDNMWISEWTHRTMYAGKWGVVRDGLTHHLIPDGWSWGGTVSDHVPIYAEFYNDKDFDTSTRESVSGIVVDTN